MSQPGLIDLKQVYDFYVDLIQSKHRPYLSDSALIQDSSYYFVQPTSAGLDFNRRIQSNSDSWGCVRMLGLGNSNHEYVLRFQDFEQPRSTHLINQETLISLISRETGLDLRMVFEQEVSEYYCGSVFDRYLKPLNCWVGCYIDGIIGQSELKEVFRSLATLEYFTHRKLNENGVIQSFNWSLDQSGSFLSKSVELGLRLLRDLNLSMIRGVRNSIQLKLDPPSAAEVAIAVTDLTQFVERHPEFNYLQEVLITL